MTQTFRQFIEECENWEYSKEYFEVMKEYSELQLARQYYESICFAEENPGLLMEGQIIEMEYDAKTNTASAIGEKSKKTKQTLLQRLLKILGPFGKFIDRLIRQHAKNKIDKKIYEHFVNRTFTPDDIKLIEEKFEEFGIIGNLCIDLATTKKKPRTNWIDTNNNRTSAKVGLDSIITSVWAEKVCISHTDRKSYTDRKHIVKDLPRDMKNFDDIINIFKYLGETSTGHEIKVSLTADSSKFGDVLGDKIDTYMWVDTDIKTYEKLNKTINETIDYLQKKMGVLAEGAFDLSPNTVMTFGKIIANGMKAIQLVTSYQTKMGKFLIDTFIDKKEA